MSKPRLSAPLVAKRKPLRLPGKPQMRLMLDSGAYSAWRSGKPVDLEAYCDFIKENEDWIETYISLDVINPNDPEAAAAEGFKNLRYMQKRGLKPMHVFHAKEDMGWLHRMLDAGVAYIGLAGLSFGSHAKTHNWYQSVWPHLVDSAGNPLVKVHALGDTKWASLQTYPWKSCDSASWLYGAQRSGRMLIEGQVISHRKDGLHQKGAPDIDRLEGEDEKALSALFQKYGVDKTAFADRAELGWLMRTYVTLQHYKHVRDRVRKKQPIIYKPRGFFDVKDSGRAGQHLQFDLYLVIGGNLAANVCLAKAQYPTALSSYFYITEKNGPELEAFCRDPHKASQALSGYAKDYWAILNKYVTET